MFEACGEPEPQRVQIKRSEKAFGAHVTRRDLLVSNFKKDHELIVKLIADAMEAGLGSDVCRRKLLGARSLLVNHIEREDRFLYPHLERESSEMARQFARDMQQISERVVRFVSKYEQGALDRAFASEAGRLIGALTARINQEENFLYQRFLEGERQLT